MEEAVKEIMDFLESKIEELNEKGFEVQMLCGESFVGKYSRNQSASVIPKDSDEWLLFRREEDGKITKKEIRKG